jgi:glycerol-3-phosphate dehydrogenase subunit B
MLIIGFDGFHDFSPSFVADNLNQQGYFAKDLTISPDSIQKLKFISGMTLARLFDIPAFRMEVIKSIKPFLQDYGRVGFPAVLGIEHAREIKESLESALGVSVFEIPGLPPSIPGIRLQKLLISAIEHRHGKVFNGMEVSNFSFSGNEVQSVWSESAAKQLAHPGKTFILATGGILGGGITINQDGYAQETIFNLPIDISNDRSHWFEKDYLSERSHAIFKTNVQANHSFQPVDTQGEVIYKNLYTIGSQSANCDPVRERSLEGIALATGFKVIENMTVI